MLEPTKEHIAATSLRGTSALHQSEEKHTDELEVPVTDNGCSETDHTYLDESVVKTTTTMNKKSDKSGEEADVRNVSDDECSVIQEKRNDEAVPSLAVSDNSNKESIDSRSQLSYNLSKYRSDLSDSSDNTDSSDTESSSTVSEDNDDNEDDSLRYQFMFQEKITNCV